MMRQIRHKQLRHHRQHPQHRSVADFQRRFSGRMARVQQGPGGQNHQRWYAYGDLLNGSLGILGGYMSQEECRSACQGKFGVGGFQTVQLNTTDRNRARAMIAAKRLGQRGHTMDDVTQRVHWKFEQGRV